ncbi:hypothetical protein Mapa_015874 [Marchantia paleacea]|nr:hypothetical protein Mapa_015874 [Marchantia paleacea]
MSVGMAKSSRDVPRRVEITEQKHVVISFSIFTSSVQQSVVISSSAKEEEHDVSSVTRSTFEKSRGSHSREADRLARRLRAASGGCTSIAGSGRGSSGHVRNGGICGPGVVSSCDSSTLEVDAEAELGEECSGCSDGLVHGCGQGFSAFSAPCCSSGSAWAPTVNLSSITTMSANRT